MPGYSNDEFFDKVVEKIKELRNDSGDYKNKLNDFSKFIQDDTTQLQKNLMLQLCLGYGGSDYVGSTKLGAGTGIILQGALGQGTEGGSIDGNRINALNDIMEDFVNDQEKLADFKAQLNQDFANEIAALKSNPLELAVEEKFNPSPFDISRGPGRP